MGQRPVKSTLFSTNATNRMLSILKHVATTPSPIATAVASRCLSSERKTCRKLHFRMWRCQIPSAAIPWQIDCFTKYVEKGQSLLQLSASIPVYMLIIHSVFSQCLCTVHSVRVSIKFIPSFIQSLNSVFWDCNWELLLSLSSSSVSLRLATVAYVFLRTFPLSTSLEETVS